VGRYTARHAVAGFITTATLDVDALRLQEEGRRDAVLASLENVPVTGFVWDVVDRLPHALFTSTRRNPWRQPEEQKR
jgi:hypothetical protein